METLTDDYYYYYYVGPGKLFKVRLAVSLHKMNIKSCFIFISTRQIQFLNLLK